MPRIIITKLVRHSLQAPKARRTKTGLTREGIIKARALGRKIPPGWKVKEYYTPAIRTESSSRFALGAFRAKGGSFKGPLGPFNRRPGQRSHEKANSNQ